MKSPIPAATIRTPRDLAPFLDHTLLAPGATVEATEIERGKRICGARTLSGKPCLLDPNHE